jgi:hypothetical protein
VSEMNKRPAEAGQEAIYASDLPRLLPENQPNLSGPCYLFEQPAELSEMITESEARSVRLIKGRFGLSPSIAALIAHLAGLGPREVRNV